MGFQAFANVSEFDDYFGKDEYNNNADYDGIWGIWDHKFLQFYAEKMNGFRQPFYTNFFSVSSHHPYNLPEEFKGKFKEAFRRFNGNGVSAHLEGEFFPA